MSSWQTTSADPSTKFRATLVKRALKRTGVIYGDNAWIVEGDDKLNDSYSEYTVVLPPGERRYKCTCQTHAGGEFRKICSHILYVILAKSGKTKFAGVRSVSPTETAPVRSVQVPETLEPVPSDPGDPSDLRSVIDEHFGEGLPDWLEELRPHQWEAVEQIERLFLEGKKAVFLDAPTGAGKTLIGELMRRRISPKRSIYACVTKTLQDQFLEDYPYADVIKGRSNYPTLNWPNQFPKISAELCDLTGGTCTMCSEVKNCHYQTAKAIARRSPLAVANMAYLLAVWNYQEDFTGTNGGAPLVILDEADTLEAELMRFVEITFTPRALDQLGIGPPEKKTVHTSWLEWIRYTARPAVLQALKQLDRKFRFFSEMPPREKKEYNRWAGALTKLEKIGGWDYPNQEWLEDFEMDNWVYTGYDRGIVTFKPVRVNDMGRDYIWKWANQFLLMSATIISADQMAEDLGLEDDEWGLVTVGSTFDPKRRPIYVDPTANMTYAEKDTAWPIMAQRIHMIILWHTDDRILIHTVSYAFAQYLKNHLHFKGNPRIITYQNSRDREPALARFKKSENGVVLAASFDRGVDLPQEECRVVIIPKIPYPNLKDKQVSRRLHGRGGQGWYAMQTVRTLVQMTGRAMRSEDDSCEIYLLDRQFVKKVYRKSKGMLPGWWKEALVMSGSPRERR